MTLLRHGSIAIICALAGCWGGDNPGLPAGNDTLGIVRFVEEEIGDQTTLRGFDASGNEVARLDLVHGRFAVSPPFTADYDTPEVDGRKLNVIALGQRLHWEDAGFEPVLKMPAHPASQWAVAAFVADPHAKGILDRWQIGFEKSEALADGEVGYLSGNYRGDSPMTCDGLTTCGTAYNGTINTCGAGGAATQAARLTRQPGTNCGLYTGPTASEVLVSQCCPATTGALGTPWFAQKACPTTIDNNTSCGTRTTGACKGCPEYPFDASQACAVSTGSTVGSCSSVSVYPLDWSFMSYTYLKSSASSDNLVGQHVAISADGNTVALAGLDSWKGGVYIFSHAVGGLWTQQAYLQASNKSSQGGLEFGDSIALSDDGNTLAVGAPFENSNATGINGSQTNTSASFAGAAYVFTRSGTVWTQQAYVKASNTGADDHYGMAVALSSDGNTLGVGAWKEDSNATGINGNQNNELAADTGAVYVYTRSGTTWTQQAYIKASNPDPGDYFGGFDNGHGMAFSDDGNTLAVVAANEASAADGVNGNQLDNTQASAGAVYVFTRSGTTWTQQAYIKAANSHEYFDFGGALALSGDGNTLAAGSARESSSSTGINGGYNFGSDGSGAVYVFTRSGTVWSQQAFVKASNTSTVDHFGYSVALSTDGNILAVGAENEDSNATLIGGSQADNSSSNSGAVYQFSRVGSTWSQAKYIKASNTGAGNHFGSGVGLASNGLLVVGALQEDSNATGVNGNQADNSDSDSGAAFIIR